MNTADANSTDGYSTLPAQSHIVDVHMLIPFPMSELVSVKKPCVWAKLFASTPIFTNTAPGLNVCTVPLYGPLSYCDRHQSFENSRQILWISTRVDKATSPLLWFQVRQYVCWPPRLAQMRMLQKCASSQSIGKWIHWVSQLHSRREYCKRVPSLVCWLNDPS